MIANRTSMLRPSFRVAYHQHVLPRLTRPGGRRTYATLQERVASSGDRPWQIAALAVTLPGVYLLRRTDDPKAKVQAHGHPGRNEEVQDRHSEPAEKEVKAEAKAESPPDEPMREEASKQKIEGAESENASSESDSEGAPTPSSPVSEQGDSKEMDDSQESQDQKLTDKQDSQRGDFTQK
ncbi:uncharacterized protein B0T15DRAFT_524710 [Chaetomium strumarium]|uniref:Uncharacterized protein n=1 Tax=Chaetomium strumarium TaxID=1170767 RepID=A0AAJ0GYK2_9PEZI|nr:hypothetical protein B0T15DRAFT_524710 [Chaetomium strumarium]